MLRAEKGGECFWKIGTTILEDPLSLNRKCFIECFRKDLLGKASAREILNAISTNINNLIKINKSEGYLLDNPKDGFSYDLPLDVLEEIYDFWLDIYRHPKKWNKCIRLLKFRTQVSPFEPTIIKGLIGSTSELALRIEQLHSYRPNTSKMHKVFQEPMWS